jgi:hypothetical protein
MAQRYFNLSKKFSDEEVSFKMYNCISWRLKVSMTVLNYIEVCKCLYGSWIVMWSWNVCVCLELCYCLELSIWVLNCDTVLKCLCMSWTVLLSWIGYMSLELCYSLEMSEWCLNCVVVLNCLLYFQLPIGSIKAKWGSRKWCSGNHLEPSWTIELRTAIPALCSCMPFLEWTVQDTSRHHKKWVKQLLIPNKDSSRQFKI